MAQRGRKSAAALALVSANVEPIPRTKAPETLTADEVDIWNQVVASQPADWFNGATRLMLEAYCRHVCEGRNVAAMIRMLKAKLTEAVANGGDPLTIMLQATDALDKLTKMHERESRAIASLATKMRLTQQATTNHRGNAIESKNPWEF